MPHEKSRRGWSDNIEIDIIDVEYEGVDCIEVAKNRDNWLRVVKTTMNI